MSRKPLCTSLFLSVKWTLYLPLSHQVCQVELGGKPVRICERCQTTVRFGMVPICQLLRRSPIRTRTDYTHQSLCMLELPQTRQMSQSHPARSGQNVCESLFSPVSKKVCFLGAGGWHRNGMHAQNHIYLMHFFEFLRFVCINFVCVSTQGKCAGAQVTKAGGFR